MAARMAFALAAFAAGFLAQAEVRAETLTVANNGGTAGAAMKAAYFEPFAKATGHKVVDDAFNQELAKIRSQVETKNLQWDVVSVTAINEATGCEEGLLEKIDWSKYLDPKDFEAVGGIGKCGLPNNFVSGGLVYDADVIPADKAPKTWADFWDVQKYPGKRGLLYRAEQTFEIALIADGVPPADAMKVLAAPGGVERALKKLGELKPHIKWWKSGDESMQNILTGEVVMTFAWNGRVAAANRNNKRNLKIVFGGGHVSGSQYIAVMKGTPKKDLAIEFIRFSSAPEQQAEFARRIDYAPANAKAYPLMSDAERATLPSGHMDKASLQSGQLYLDFWLNNGDALLQRFITFAAQ
ncbi:ABC transporter substrate-binding protein [Prosthecomicrobium sp. N25]|uniref:ABC transporter substrate-binding protein n=1 Tax=Prosthecomicrobium sp. N25 TaxID=3129254 RepID=UPI003076985E